MLYAINNIEDDSQLSLESGPHCKNKCFGILKLNIENVALIRMLRSNEINCTQLIFILDFKTKCWIQKNQYHQYVNKVSCFSPFVRRLKHTVQFRID